jgi:hypothetical protein
MCAVALHVHSACLPVQEDAGVGLGAGVSVSAEVLLCGPMCIHKMTVCIFSCMSAHITLFQWRVYV